MNTYYIVEVTLNGDTRWEAHTGLLARLGFFYFVLTYVSATSTEISPDRCEERLRQALGKKTYRVIRVVKI